MRSNSEHKNLEGEAYRELRMLEEFQRTPDMSQRHLAHRLGIALGVTNVLVRGVAKRGYIRIVQVKWKRWAYVLTPAGIARKVQLTFAYVERFLDHYRRVRQLLTEDVGSLALTSESQVAIYGRTELAELLFLVLRDIGVLNIHVIDVNPEKSTFLGMPVHTLSSMSPEEYTKIFVAFPADVEDRCEEMQQKSWCIPLATSVTCPKDYKCAHSLGSTRPCIKSTLSC